MALKVLMVLQAENTLIWHRLPKANFLPTHWNAPHHSYNLKLSKKNVEEQLNHKNT